MGLHRSHTIQRWHHTDRLTIHCPVKSFKALKRITFCPTFEISVPLAAIIDRFSSLFSSNASTCQDSGHTHTPAPESSAMTAFSPLGSTTSKTYTPRSSLRAMRRQLRSIQCIPLL